MLNYEIIAMIGAIIIAAIIIYVGLKLSKAH